MKRQYLLLISVALLLGCSGLPEPIAKAPGKSPVSGAGSGNRHVLIRTVNDSEVLRVKGGHPGTEAWLAPGQHELGLICIENSWRGSIFIPTTLSLSVRPNTGYRLSATFTANGEECVVRVSELRLPG